MKKLSLALCTLLASTSAFALTVQSPNGKTVLNTEVIDGKAVYSVTENGKVILENSPLGFMSNIGDFYNGLTMLSHTEGEVDKAYTQDKIKKSDIHYQANTLTVDYKTAEGKKFSVEFQVSNNNVAFRYNIPRQKDTGSIVINEEMSGFRFPEYTTTFITPQSDAMIGWKRTKPSYEEFYVADCKMDTISEYGHGYTFPALFRVGDNGWALLTETNVDGYYCGSRLSDYQDGVYTIAYPMPEENNGNGSAAPGLALPGSTPWRTITVGEDLAPIVETTVVWDLVEPRYQVQHPARNGKGTWSWIVWQDDAINWDDSITFIDLAADMGYSSVLIDCAWDTEIGRERIPELVEYAKSKGVDVLLWYSSSGWWNDITQSPTNHMDRPIVRKNEMRWLKDVGVDGIKVDFFGGDKQETIRLYEDILSDAADYGIDVIFHGCTLPRGWERMYPNYIGSEAVLASENMIFSQDFCDLEAFHATLHPFIRNSVGIMEYGGSFLNRYMHKSNKKGNLRHTGDAFSLATAVLFQNPVQNFAITPNNLTESPEAAIRFMKEVPTAWKDVKYVEGYPGKYVVIAREAEDGGWYIAGVNNEEKTQEIKINLSQFPGEFSSIEVFYDKDPMTMDSYTVKPNTKAAKNLKIKVPQNCGFVVVAKKQLVENIENQLISGTSSRKLWGRFVYLLC